ncbi:uncharacterized protein PHACADRAFT_250794 [Phanerochaete carnosa HHB-10118-sp]|uniref:Uncharacterized protein n=1 Tax=Phanerochaete carnosa (strain HHB-10118-sp) TaxID=650164 RepID=K5VAS8_PHACS|nr:uncharacterized protein PHACADRAFT_250794 [Phanerochaete carnosa HHB-10118-sp]EKM59971.1 hypothetical protein PHACADRAFT_250794 [Phanerochaete carnosa HHB-10118-sp]
MNSTGQIVDIPNFNVSAGDNITISLNATSTTSGTVYIINQSTGQNVSEVVPTGPLCLEEADWLVTDLILGGTPVPLAAFGSIDFANASAQTPSGPLDLSGAMVLDISQNNTVLTSSSVTSSNVTVIDLNAV